MKNLVIKFVLLLCSAFTAGTASATNANYREYSHPYVDLTLVYNYSYIRLATLLEYKGMAEILNDYAAERAKDGVFGNRKIWIQIGGTLFVGPKVEMWRSADYYYLFIRDWPGMEKLMQAIDYFAHPEWESLVYEDYQTAEGEFRQLDKRFDKYVPNPDTSFANGRAVTVYTDGDIEITYKYNELILSLGGVLLEGIDLGNIYPVKFRDRYIVFEQKKFTVYTKSEDGSSLEKIHEFKVPEDTIEEWNYDYYARVYPEWMNVYFNSERYPLFSYSYARNRFYTVPTAGN